MVCPFCGYADSKVTDSRSTEEGSIRRRRECIGCGKRFTTYETIEAVPLMVIKKDGKREVFDKNKLMHGIIKSCEKRPVSMHNIDTLAFEIEQSFRNELAREITSIQIGEKVMDGLKKLDEVAYVRFASVYRQFKDIKSFKQELENLLNEK